MSYISKRTIVSMAAGAVLVVAYIIYALGDKAPAPDALSGWARAILIFIVISIVAQIIIQIVFNIIFSIGVGVREGNCGDGNIKRILAVEMKEDERYKMISLKSLRAGYVISGIGSVAMLISLAFGNSVLISLHIFFAGCALGSLVEGLTSIYYNETGIIR